MAARADLDPRVRAGQDRVRGMGAGNPRALRDEAPGRAARMGAQQPDSDRCPRDGGGRHGRPARTRFLRRANGARQTRQRRTGSRRAVPGRDRRTGLLRAPAGRGTCGPGAGRPCGRGRSTAIARRGCTGRLGSLFAQPRRPARCSRGVIAAGHGRASPLPPRGAVLRPGAVVGPGTADDSGAAYG